MSRVHDRHWLRRLGIAVVVLAAICLVLIASTAVTVSAGHGLDQLTLALPVFFVFYILAAALGDWFDFERCLFVPEPELTAALTRGPPA